MKKITKIKKITFVSLFLYSFNNSSFAQNINRSTLQLGVGKNIVANQINHFDYYSEGLYDIDKPKLGDHFSLQWKRQLNNKYFIIAGLSVDFSKYTYNTNRVPDSSFSNTKFSFQLPR